MSKGTVIILFSGLLILLFTLIVILIGRGYLPDLDKRTLQPTGILLATSDPDGARVFVNGKLTTATNNTINLNPGDYDVKIEKDGFSAWEKKIKIKREEVIKTNAFLFPRVPDLRPLTLTGALNPQISLDQRRIAFGVASGSAEKNGVRIIDTDGGRPIIGGVDSKLIYQDKASLELSDGHFLWGPDNLQLLVYYFSGDIPLASPSANPYRILLAKPAKSAKTPFTITRGYLLQTSQLNSSPVEISSATATETLGSWADLWDDRQSLALSKIDPRLSEFLRQNGSQINISLDESKVLYTATTSAAVPHLLNYYLPGTNPTPEDRQIKPGRLYVYDIKEDRNYYIDIVPRDAPLVDWFPSSRHLLAHNDHEISVMEFDGTNKSTLYTGPFTKDLVISWPNWSKIIILTSLNATGGGANLYTINLR